MAEKTEWLDRKTPFVKREDPPRNRVAWETKTASGLLQLLSVGANLESKPSVTSPFAENGWVHACLKAIGQAVAGIELRFTIGDPRYKDGPEPKPLPDKHPLVLLFNRPNPIHRTMARFFEAGVYHRKLDGDDIWFLMDKGGKPIAGPGSGKIPVPEYILPVRGNSVSLTTNSLGWPATFRYSSKNSGGTSDFPVDSVLQFADFDPDNPLRGIGDVEAAYVSIDMEWQAQRYQNALLHNSGDPGGFILCEQFLDSPSKQGLEDEANQSRGPERAGRYQVLEGGGKGIKYEANSVKPKDMEFRELRKWERDAILSILGVPPIIVGVYENATLNNFEEAKQIFWENTILTYLLSIENVLNCEFLPRLNIPNADKIIARFDLSNVKALQEDDAPRHELAIKYVTQVPGISLNEAHSMVKLEVDTSKVEYADEHLAQGTLKPMEDVLDPPAPIVNPNAPPGTIGDPPKDGEPKPKPPKEDEDKTVKAETNGHVPFKTKTAESERGEYWHAKEATILTGGEKKVGPAYRKWRRKYEAAQIRRLRAFAEEGHAGLRVVVLETKATDNTDDPPSGAAAELEAVLNPKDVWSASMQEALLPAIQEIFVDALEDMAEELNGIPLVGSDQRVIDFLSNQMIKLAEGHTSTLAHQVRDTLLKGLEEATSTGTLQQQIAEMLPELTAGLKQTFSDRHSRALTIARTETGKAANGARLEQMKASNVLRAEWVTSRDAAVRGTPGGPSEDAAFNHAELDGRVAVIGTEFDPAGHPGLKFPGDPDGQPGDVINCFPAGTPVLTARGDVAIEDVRTGDLVLTHRNRWRPVIERHINRSGSELCEVRLQGGRTFRITPAHKLYVVGKGWIEAGALERGDQLVDVPALSKIHTAIGEVEHPHPELFDVEMSERIQIHRRAVDLHGGGQIGEEKVQVVHALPEVAPRVSSTTFDRESRNRVLCDASNVGLLDPRPNDKLSWADRSPLSEHAAVLKARAANLSLTDSTSGVLAPCGLVSLRRVTNRDAKPTHQSSEAVALVDTCLAREVADGGQLGQVATTQVGLDRTNARFGSANSFGDTPSSVANLRAVLGAGLNGSCAVSADVNHGSDCTAVESVYSVTSRHSVFNLGVAEDMSYFAAGVLGRNCRCLTRAVSEKDENEP